MKEDTIKIYNDVMNHLDKAACLYYAMANDACYNDLKGFYRFCRNESKERWKMKDCINKYLLKRWVKPTPIAMKVPPLTFDNTTIAIAGALKVDEAIKIYIEDNIKDIDLTEISKINRIYSCICHEFREVQKVQKKLELSGDYLSFDTYLYGEYEDYNEDYKFYKKT